MFTQKGALVNPKNGSQLLLNVHFVKIKNEHGNVHFNYVWFQIFQIKKKKKKKCLFKLKIFDITMSTYIS